MQDRIDEFEGRSTSGDKPKEMDELFKKPFDTMGSQLSAAPMALKILGQLTLVATNRDFALNDGKTPVKFDYLKYPGSFRASLSQVSNETWYSFYQAHKGMYRIKLTTGQVKNHLKRALDALFKGTDAEIESQFPISIKRIGEVADEAITESRKVVDQFEKTQNVIQELIDSGINKREDAKSKKQQNALNIQIEDRRKADKARQLKENKQQRADLQKEIAKVQNQFDAAIAATEPSGWATAGTLLLGALGPILDSVGQMSQRTRYIRGKNKTKIIKKEASIGSAILKGLAGLSSKSSNFLAAFNSDKEQIAESDIDNLLAQQPEADPINIEKEYANKNLANAIKLFQALVPDVGKFFKKDGTLDLVALNIANSVPSSTKKIEATHKEVQGYKAKGANQSVLNKFENIIKSFLKILGELKQASEKGIETLPEEEKLFKEEKKKLKALVDIDSTMLSGTPGITKKGPNNRNLKKRAAENDDEDDADKIKSAHMKLMTLKEQLNRAQEQNRQESRRARKLNEDLQKSMDKLDQFNSVNATLFETIEVLREGLQSLGELREQWAQLVLFFEEMASLINLNLGKPLKDFVERAKATKNIIDQDGKDAIGDYSKETLYEIAYKASSTAFVVNRRADAYHKISQDHLMPTANKIPKLMALDPADPSQFQQMKDGKAQVIAESQASIAAIQEIIKESQEDYENKIEAKKKELDNNFKLAGIPELESREKRDLENQIKETGENINSWGYGDDDYSG
jgi:hypothetical protein